MNFDCQISDAFGRKVPASSLGKSDIQRIENRFKHISND